VPKAQPSPFPDTLAVALAAGTLLPRSPEVPGPQPARWGSTSPCLPGSQVSLPSAKVGLGKSNELAGWGVQYLPGMGESLGSSPATHTHKCPQTHTHTHAHPHAHTPHQSLAWRRGRCMVGYAIECQQPNPMEFGDFIFLALRGD
jgi:hypothetical protein